MRSADLMRRRVVLAILLALLIPGCADGFEPLSTTVPPTTFRVEAERPGVVRLTWSKVDQPDVISYRIERRANLAGPFIRFGGEVPQSSLGELSWIDTDVEPDTYYGYRIITVTRFGDLSAPSVVGGTRTPPPPGIDVVMTTRLPSPESGDPDGYQVRILGPDTVSSPMGTTGRRRFSPLRVGSYAIVVSGLIDRCSVEGQATRSVDVVDTLPTTIVPVEFVVVCRDPRRGDVTAAVDVTGQDRDEQYTIDLLGEADDPSLPDSVRIVSRQISVTPGAPARFVNLYPGTYDVTLRDIAPNCVVSGPTSRSAQVTPLGNVVIGFTIACARVGGGGGAAKKYTLRNRWEPATASQGSRVKLLVDLDLSASSARRVAGVEAVLRYNPSVLRYEDALPGRLGNLTANATEPGTVTWVAFTLNPAGGVVRLVELEFTVLGTAGRQAPTFTEGLKLADRGPGGEGIDFSDSTGVVEDTLEVGNAASNQPPTAVINGPMSGLVGAPLQFNANGSADPDGTVASFGWTMGDNTSRTGSAITHSYAAAGSYVVTLTVTDDRGGTGAATRTVTITTPNSGNQSPTARANGPYSGTVNVPVTLNAAGSSDPDGTIASYSWAVGGTTKTGASVTHTFTTPGNYVAVLTVTDNQGATATAQANIAITAAPSNQPPIAEANGPYSAVAGQPVTLSAAGSRDPDGSIVTYSWALGNGQGASGSAPNAIYATAGAYTATLTVTDDKGATSSDQATVNVTQPTNTTPLVWRNEFGPVDVASGIVTLRISYDLRTDLPETAGPEALQTFVVDSLRWDPSVLQFLSATFGPNVIGNTIGSATSQGRLKLSGNVSYPQAQGLVQIAVVQLRLVGATGRVTATQTWLGTLRAQPTLGGITYNSRTQTIEASFTTP